MKRWAGTLTAAVICAGLSIFFAAILLRYTVPMEDAVYDLSLIWEGEAEPEDWVYDQKGWSVFVQEGERREELTPDGMGGFYGAFQPGQTFYFSRTLKEELDSPQLRIEPYNHSIVVFLEDEVIYSDVTEGKERIGGLALPELAWTRSEEVIVPLPGDCRGKTLTVAQSSDSRSEFLTATPCPISLYCGFAYESGLIAESFSAAVGAALLLAAGVALLVLFVVQVREDRADPGVFGIAVAAFLGMSRILTKTSFFHNYQARMSENWTNHLTFLTLVVLLAVLSGRAPKFRAIPWLLTGSYTAAWLVRIAVESRINERWVFLLLWEDVPVWIGAVSLLVILILAWTCWRRKSRFYRIYAPLVTAGMLLCLVLALLLYPGTAQQLVLLRTQAHLTYFFYPMIAVSMTAALASFLAEQTQREFERRMEAGMMARQTETVLQGYENLRVHQEEVMMLRHDMAKHLQILRQMTKDDGITGYLQELIAENEQISSVVQTENQIVDIILNGKLAQAKTQGIHVEIVRAQAPEKLPISDRQLSSVMMNLMDNALAGAQKSGANPPFLRLDLHMKNGFFVFQCTNSVSPEYGAEEETDTLLAHHGYGLKIVQKILKTCGALYEVKCGDGVYDVQFAIRLGNETRQKTISSL